MKKIFSYVGKKINEAWSLDTRSLSLFRVGLALVVIVDLCLRSRFLIEHYTDLGVFPRSAYLDIADKSMLSLHMISGEAWFQVILFLIHSFFALCMLVGYRTWIATIVVWVFTVSLQNRIMIINSGADDLLRLILFWSMFLQLDRHWAWESDRWRASLHPNLKRIFGITAVAFIAQQILLYWVTAYLKLGPEWYGTHSAVYEILSLEGFRTGLGNWLYQNMSLMSQISWGSILVEIIAPLLLVFPIFNTWTRLAGIIAIIGLHIGIVTNIGVGIFPWVSIVSILALIPTAFWDTLIKSLAPRGEMKIYFDDHCELCHRWVRLLRSYCFLWGVDYIGMSQAPESIQKTSEENDSWVTTRGRKNFVRYGAFVELMKQSWLLRPLSFIGNIFPLNIIGNKVYKLGNHMRQYCRIAHPVIPYPSYPGAMKIAALICGISLYVVVIVNLSVISCGQAWRGFFRAFPLSASAIYHERGLYLAENNHVNYGHGGWSGEGMLAPKKAETCSNISALGKSLPQAVQNIIRWHGDIIWWWTFLPRLDQYWGMFSPNPLSNDYWLVVDADLIESDRSTSTKKDLWKEYSISQSSVSFEKPENIHELSISDRWRKYTNNVIEWNDTRYVEQFARSWCKKYNNDNTGETLERLTIYGLWQKTESDYRRGPVEKKPLWQHCCLKDGCFIVPAPQPVPASAPSTVPTATVR